MKIKDIPIKQNANQVTDPNTQVSAEEFNALVENAKESVTSMEVLAGQEEVKLSYGKGKGTSSALTFPTATAAGAGMMSPKQAARIADRTASDGMGYVVLDKGKTFAEQVTQENTIYEIRYEFDLGGVPKEIPAGCVLKFEGGSLKNGTIKGTNTALSGVSISVDKISGSFDCDIRSSFSSMTCDHSKLTMLLALGVNKVIFDEDYEIATSASRFTTYIPHIIGEDVTFSINTDIPQHLIYFSLAKEIKGITFDHNNHQAEGAFVASNNDKLLIENVCVKNIYITDNSDKYKGGITGINCICASDGIIEFSHVTIDNLKSTGNSTIGSDAIGVACGLYCGQNYGQPHKCTYYLHDSQFINISCVDTNGKVIQEDGKGAYFSVTDIVNNKSNLIVRNIFGHNYGKRLLKIDMTNIDIDGVDAVQEIANQGLAVVGLNNKDTTLLGSNSGADSLKGASVRNIKFRGSTAFVVACAISDVYIENVDAKMYTGGTENVAESTDNTFMSLINVGPYAHNITARNIHAENCCLVTDTGVKAIVQNSAGTNIEDVVDREDQIILQNVTCVNDIGIVSVTNQTFLNTSHSNVLIENIFIKTNNYIGMHKKDTGKVTIRGIKLVNNMANTRNDWTFTNNNGSKNDSLEIYDFDIEVRRGLFGLYNPAKVLLKNGTVRVNIASGYYPTSCGLITCDGSSDITIEDVKILNEGESAISSDLWISNTTDNAQKVNVRNSLSSINSAKNAYWEDAPLTVLGTPALRKGLVRRYTLQGHFTADFRYMDSGFELISRKSITYAAAQAWSGNTTVPPQVGVQIYLSDKGKTAWWSGSAWVDAMGATIQ